MSVRSDRSAPASEASTVDTAVLADVDHVNATISAAQNADSVLGEANSISTNSPHHPLKRTIAVNIRASLSDLCLRKQKGTWAPSAEALRAMLQCAHHPFTKEHASRTPFDVFVNACLRLWSCVCFEGKRSSSTSRARPSPTATSRASCSTA